MAEEGKRRNLGRGLEALFGEDPLNKVARPESIENKQNPAVEYTRIVNLVRGKYQPRVHFDEQELKDLAASIKTNGIIQPILVRENSKGPEEWEIVAGERRWRAAQMAQLHDVPIIVRKLTDAKVLELALVENLQREDLSPLEEAHAYQQLIDEFAQTQEELGKILGKSRSHVANTARLLTLSEEVKKLLAAGKLSAGHARALLNTKNQVKLANEIVKKGLNVRQTENLVKKESVKRRTSSKKYEKNVDTLALETELSSFLGLRVIIKDSNSRGKVTIEYETLEQLDGILDRLKKTI